MNTFTEVRGISSLDIYVVGYWSVIRALRQSNQGDIADVLENTVCNIRFAEEKDSSEEYEEASDEEDFEEKYTEASDEDGQSEISLLELIMHTSQVRKLVRMGFKRRALETVIKHQLEKTGTVLIHLLPFICEMLLHARYFSFVGCIVTNLACFAGQWFSSFEDFYDRAVHFTDFGCCVDPSCRRRIPSRMSSSFYPTCVLEYVYVISLAV